MIRELKYLFQLMIIFIFFFLCLKFYISDSNKKKFYRALNNQNNQILEFSKNLPTLKNDTNNIIEYVDNNINKSKKKYKFWKLLEND
jgi:hypothetical protein